MPLPDVPTLPRTFLNLPNRAEDYGRATGVVLPVPYDCTGTGQNTRDGPYGILDASQHIWERDHSTGIDPRKNGVFTHDPLAPIAGNPEAMVKRVETVIRHFLDDHKFPVMLGGEHTLAVGGVRAAQSLHGDLSVLVVDAHLDLMPEWQVSRWSHACTMVHISRLLNPVKRGALWVAPISIIGVRDYSAEELALAKEWGIAATFDDMFEPGSDEWLESALERLTTNVYLNIDVDGLDSAVMPACGTPQPGELTFHHLNALLTELFQSGRNVVAVDVVEHAPIPDNMAPSLTLAKLVWRIFAHKFSRK